MKALLIILGVFIGLGILLSAPGIMLVPFTLLVGWFPAARRLFHDLPFTGSDLSLFTAACVLFLCGVHRFFRSLRPWPFRWTLALTGTCALVLLGIMSLVGAAHQAGWMAFSSERIFIDRRSTFIRERMDLERTAKIISIIADTNAFSARSSGSTLIADTRLPDTYDRRRPWEKFHFVVLDAPNDDFAILWPRDEKTHRRMGSVAITAEREVRLHSADYVSVVIGKIGTHVTEAY